jgi:hypothetical protein
MGPGGRSQRVDRAEDPVGGEAGAERRQCHRPDLRRRAACGAVVPVTR